MAVAPAPVLKQTRPAGRRWVTGVLSAALFLSGGVIGFGVAAIAIHKHRSHLHSHSEALPDNILTMIRNELGIELDTKQTAEVMAILCQRQEALQTIRAQSRTRFDAEFDQLDEQISAVLPEAERGKWHEAFRQNLLVWFPTRANRFPPPGAGGCRPPKP